MWAKRFRRANRNARNRPVNNEETEEQGPTNEVTLENVLKLAGNTALIGMHARKLKAANAAAEKLVYHQDPQSQASNQCNIHICASNLLHT